MPVAGLVRLRKHLFGRQAAFGTKVDATRAYAFRGVPSNELNWTDPEVDVGSIDPSAAPSRGAPELTADLTDSALRYNNLPIMLSAFFGGAVAPTGAGTAQTWTYEPSSTTVEEFDPFTYQFGDDVVTDWFELGDGILESVEFTGPEGLGPLEASMSWRFGSFSSTGSTDFPDSGYVPAALDVDPNEAIVYLKDMAIAIADTTAGLAAGQITDALHTFTLRLSGDIGQKRYANGDQSFDVDAYVRETRAIELECTFAKTSATVGLGSESDDWTSDQAVDRFVRLTFTSTVLAEGPGTYNSWVVTMPMRYYTRTEGEVGGNSVIVLTGHAWYDPDDLGFAFTSTVVNTLTDAELGDAGS